MKLSFYLTLSTLQPTRCQDKTEAEKLIMFSPEVTVMCSNLIYCFACSQKFPQGRSYDVSLHPPYIPLLHFNLSLLPLEYSYILSSHLIRNSSSHTHSILLLLKNLTVNSGWRHKLLGTVASTTSTPTSNTWTMATRGSATNKLCDMRQLQRFLLPLLHCSQSLIIKKKQKHRRGHHKIPLLVTMCPRQTNYHRLSM